MKFYYLLLLLVITACTNATESTTEKEIENNLEEIAETVRDIEEEEKEEEKPVASPDSILVPSFSIHFNFSEKVQKVLDSGDERLVVDLVLSGMPVDKSRLIDKDYYSSEDEQVYLKNIEILYEQNKGQTLTIENLKISEEALNTLNSPNYTVGLNFYSSRTSSEDNIFSANALIEDVNTMKNKTHTVKVKML
jgi:hypothetical protein